MTDAQFMGMLIAAIVTLLTIASIITAIILKPIINLNRTITKLDTTIANIEKDNGTLKHRVDLHGEQLDEVRIKVSRHEEELKHHSSEIAALQMKNK